MGSPLAAGFAGARPLRGARPLTRCRASGACKWVSTLVLGSIVLPRNSEPEWRNWQTRETQNLVRLTASVGSIPSSGTNSTDRLTSRQNYRASTKV